MPPIHGKQIHFCVGTGHEKFSRLVGTIRTCPVLLIRSVHHARFTNAMVTAAVFTLFIICSFMNVYVGVDVGVEIGVDVGVGVGVNVGVNVGVHVDNDVDAGVIHFILPAAHTAGRQVLDVSVLLHLPET